MDGHRTDKAFRRPPPRRPGLPLGNLLEEVTDTPDPDELIVQANGQVRQAGATNAEDQWTRDFRRRCESHLYVLGKVVLKHEFFTAIHREMCEVIQLPRPEPWRCGFLGPREVGKSSIVGRCLPFHILIQPKAFNIYFRGESGREQRGVICCETEERGGDHLSVIQEHSESNELLRAFWPDCFWETRPKKAWNSQELTFPRETPWPDPTLRAKGVGGAVTGSHPSYKINDDLIGKKAMNSPLVMQEAIEWMMLSRALINKPGSIEWTIGTRWTVLDLYAHLMRNDPSVQFTIRHIVEDGRVIWPEHYDPLGDGSMIERLKKEYGPLYWLQFMNSAANPELTDFKESDIRTFEFEDGKLVIVEDGRDIELMRMMNKPAAKPTYDAYKGLPLTPDLYDRMRRESPALRLRAA